MNSQENPTPLHPVPTHFVSPLHALLLPELFEALGKYTAIDETDWLFATRFAEKWKVSVADALLDLHFFDETALAKALATAQGKRARFKKPFLLLACG